MKNINESELINYIFKKLQESYFDDLGFDDEAMKAAMKDIEASGEDFEDLGASKFEKDPKFKEKFTAALNRANLELPSDEEEVENLAKMMKDRKSHEEKFGVGSLNEIDMEYIKDANGKPIKLKSPVQHKTGINGYVERFMVGDDKDMKVKINWIQDPGVEKLNPIVSPEEIIIKESANLNEEDYESKRYMFFSNLKQIRRQAGLMLNMNEDQLNSILENGHDWAQDHIAIAKENVDQVFDFLMNKTKNNVRNDDSLEFNGVEKEIEEGSGHSYIIGKGENEKPSNYPENLTQESIKKTVKKIIKEDEYQKLSFFDKIKLKLAGISEEQAIDNLNNGLPIDWTGSKEGYYDQEESRGNYAGTNESLEEDMDKTDYQFNKEMLDYEAKEELNQEFNTEIYYVIDSEFNQKNYPDLIGKTFDTPPAFAQVEVVRKGEVEEGSSNSLFNKHSKNAKPNTSHLKEDEHNEETYEQIIFLQDNEADHALNILKLDGKDEAMDYLMQLDNGDSVETSEDPGFGASDKTYERDGYIMAWNAPLGYISLVRISKENMDEDSQRKRHTAGQIGKVAKNIPLGQNAPHSDSAEGL
jgi:hypothetical protein